MFRWDHGSSRQSRSSRSASRTSSSRVRSSQSPVQAREEFILFTISQRGFYPTEDQKKEHYSADLVEVVSWIHELCSLSPASAEGRRMHSFRLG